MRLHDFQVTGADFMFDNPMCMNADQMGLGKTIQTIELMNRINPARVLIVCPASLKYNWRREIYLWQNTDLTVGIADGSYLPNTDIVIINYDILNKNLHKLTGPLWDLIVFDESHYIKNKDAKRTEAAMVLEAPRIVLLTGTPILNKPIELWTQLRRIGAISPTSFMRYARKFCRAHQIRVGQRTVMRNGVPTRVGGRLVWVMNGAGNIDQLSASISKYIIRRTKDEVLPELPDKVRQVIELDNDYRDSLVGAYAQRIYDLTFGNVSNSKTYAQRVDELLFDMKIEFEEMARTRHEQGLAKVPAVIKHLEDAIESSGKVVCFAYHRDVIDAIYQNFKGRAVVIHGGINAEQRERNVRVFQEDDDFHLFIGQITAAGAGITLTASSHVVFAELDWVPGNMLQAEDRCHRIGQKNSVLIQHLVFNDTLEALMAKVLIAKQRIIERVHKGGTE